MGKRKPDPRTTGVRPTCSLGMQAYYLTLAGWRSRDACELLGITESAARQARRSVEPK